MVKLWKRFRDWMIRKLGGVTREAAEAIAERWDEDVHRLAVLLEKNAALTDTNEQLRDENKRMEKELKLAAPNVAIFGDRFGDVQQELLRLIAFIDQLPEDKQAGAKRAVRALLKTAMQSVGEEAVQE